MMFYGYENYKTSSLGCTEATKKSRQASRVPSVAQWAIWAIDQWYDIAKNVTAAWCPISFIASYNIIQYHIISYNII